MGEKKKSVDNLHAWVTLHEFNGKGSRLCKVKTSQTRGTGTVCINFAFSVSVICVPVKSWGRDCGGVLIRAYMKNMAISFVCKGRILILSNCSYITLKQSRVGSKNFSNMRLPRKPFWSVSMEGLLLCKNLLVAWKLHQGNKCFRCLTSIWMWPMSY